MFLECPDRAIIEPIKEISTSVVSIILRDYINLEENQPNISRIKIRNQIAFFPPLEEQQAIVEKVNSLMTLCDELEQQIETSQTQIEQLMQSCLKEVFEHESN